MDLLGGGYINWTIANLQPVPHNAKEFRLLLSKTN